jgi:hypothetical protein
MVNTVQASGGVAIETPALAATTSAMAEILTEDHEPGKRRNGGLQ